MDTCYLNVKIDLMCIFYLAYREKLWFLLWLVFFHWYDLSMILIMKGFKSIMCVCGMFDAWFWLVGWLLLILYTLISEMEYMVYIDIDILLVYRHINIILIFHFIIFHLIMYPSTNLVAIIKVIPINHRDGI